MKISIHRLWQNCISHLETNFLENNNTEINWLPQITPLKQYLDQRNQHQEVIQIDISNSTFRQTTKNSISTPLSNEILYDEETKISPKKLKKLNRLSKILYQIDEENNIQPTPFVQSYFKHKTLSDKAQLDSKIQELQNISYTTSVDQKAKSALNDWCNNGYKYEYEQILYFFNQIGTMIPANLSEYFSNITNLPKTKFKTTTCLPFNKINTPELWSLIRLPIKKIAHQQIKNKTASLHFNFEFAQIPLVTPYFPSSHKSSSSTATNLLSKSILLLKNILFEDQSIFLEEESINLEEPLVMGFKYEKIVL